MLPKTGNKLHPASEEIAFAGMMSEALVEELGSTHQAVKTLMRWTGASERSAKHWLAGTHAPRGTHLLSLIRHSDQALRRLLVAAGREEMLVALEIDGMHRKLTETSACIEKLRDTMRFRP